MEDKPKIDFKALEAVARKVLAYKPKKKAPESDSQKQNE